MPKRRTFIFLLFFWVGPAHMHSPWTATICFLTVAFMQQCCNHATWDMRHFGQWFLYLVMLIYFCYFLLGIDAEFVSMHVEVTV